LASAGQATGHMRSCRRVTLLYPLGLLASLVERVERVRTRWGIMGMRWLRWFPLGGVPSWTTRGTPWTVAVEIRTQTLPARSTALCYARALP